MESRPRRLQPDLFPCRCMPPPPPAPGAALPPVGKRLPVNPPFSSTSPTRFASDDEQDCFDTKGTPCLGNGRCAAGRPDRSALDGIDGAWMGPLPANPLDAIPAQAPEAVESSSVKQDAAPAPSEARTPSNPTKTVPAPGPTATPSGFGLSALSPATPAHRSSAQAHTGRTPAPTPAQGLGLEDGPHAAVTRGLLAAAQVWGVGGCSCCGRDGVRQCHVQEFSSALGKPLSLLLPTLLHAQPASSSRLHRPCRARLRRRRRRDIRPLPAGWERATPLSSRPRPRSRLPSSPRRMSPLPSPFRWARPSPRPRPGTAPR